MNCERATEVAATRRPRLRAACLALAGAGLLCGPAGVHAQPATVLTAISITGPANGAPPMITVEADGTLPAPTVGVLADPARIYLDFPHVRMASGARISGSDPGVRGVRHALHSLTPIVTRVVIDLVVPIRPHIDRTALGRGRLFVLLGGSPPSGGSPLTGYTQQVTAALEGLQELRAVLEAIDRRAAQLPPAAAGAEAEFDRLAKTLGTVKPPAGLVAAHDMLLRACMFGARGVRLRIASGSTNDSLLQAASAAAGALMLIERATRELAASK